MRECRYKDNCAVNEVNSGDPDYIPCNGISRESLCMLFEPMPDREALLLVADDLERDAKDCGVLLAARMIRRAKRIREALGVADDGRR